ncbi:hypothetical protein DL770_003648 [Monosporascus sp. CRB-9-2]|nr:hypothetical protein DL770_003648 [Monosporascus sp. CRB-9-2]
MQDDDFTVIPILDLSLGQSPETKPQFLSELQDALIRAFFQLPIDKKLDVEITHSKHFFGYCRIGTETTGNEVNYSEFFGTGPNLPAPTPDQPVYFNLQGPSQWPDETTAPGFRRAVERYRSAVQKLSTEFTVLIAEALDIVPSSVTKLFGGSSSRLELRNYPAPSKQMSEAVCYGIGAHKDSTLMTYLLQQGSVNCLEVQNKSGQWIPVPPIPGTLVVNIGLILEALTHGVCTATLHRVVLNPESFIGQNGLPLGPRLSIPFFQNLDLHLKQEDFSLDIPPHIEKFIKGEKAVENVDHFFSGVVDNTYGDAVFVQNITANLELGRRWYPDFQSLALEKQTMTK